MGHSDYPSLGCVFNLAVERSESTRTGFGVNETCAVPGF